MRRRALIAAGAVAIVAGIIGSAIALRGPMSEWQVVFDGYGKGFTQFGTDEAARYELVPNAADSARRTHAVLVVGRTEQSDFRLNTQMRTREQLRVGVAPNPWDVAWLVWRYRDPEHFYYLTLKTNGWEVGKRDPAYKGGQRFLATGTAPQFAVGDDWRRVGVVADGSVMTVTVDGVELARVDDTERPMLRGRVGMYTEDARVEFGPFRVVPATA